MKKATSIKIELSVIFQQETLYFSYKEWLILHFKYVLFVHKLSFRVYANIR